MLQLLAAVQGVGILNQTNIILTDLSNNTLGSINLSKSKLVVISVVKDIDQIGEERVNFLKIMDEQENLLQDEETGQELSEVYQLCFVA